MLNLGRYDPPALPQSPQTSQNSTPSTQIREPTQVKPPANLSNPPQKHKAQSTSPHNPSSPIEKLDEWRTMGPHQLGVWSRMGEVVDLAVVESSDIQRPWWSLSTSPYNSSSPIEELEECRTIGLIIFVFGVVWESGGGPLKK